ncbi:class I SAM-dependent methyltransferase [Gillisia hiemivivida]|uniref:Class I SAM-dependent methyltransferase n=1 Tax=Gillisia hiemivivida TaxID=291190 RepID=A0A5C6ZYV8_9FLAO|nr:class I SAM-dependent methyltransferase [Gillisia hiemivivida]TXD95326.1 class I SAM-dependent methyltransferase [Gillisia hiemivivida]
MDHVESKKKHWETIYDTKKLNEVSWYQAVPETSLNFINSAEVSKDAQIIDIGGGDSFLADNLISIGYTNLSVLDISGNAIERAKKRLRENADEVTWIVSDITDFKPSISYDIWHDRAAFHFLTSSEDIRKYLDTMESAITPNGYLILGTFSENGPTKCSGIEIKQYSIEELKTAIPDTFKFIEGKNIDHPTPSGSMQNFTFCKFQKI